MFDLDKNELLACDGPGCGRTNDTAMRRQVLGRTRVLCQQCVSMIYPQTHGWMKPEVVFAPSANTKAFGTFKRT